MNAVRSLLALLVVAASAAAAQTRGPSEYNGFDVSGALIPVGAIERGGPPRDGIPAIDRPQFVSAARAGLRADDRILGLAFNGVTRAYPVRILNWHEVVNDRFGEVPVAITYCPLCGTGVAFDARLGERVLDFGVSGLLYNSDVLLYDRGTQSLWSQSMQLAVTGPLKGTRLQALSLEHTSWQTGTPGTLAPRCFHRHRLCAGLCARPLCRIRAGATADVRRRASRQPFRAEGVGTRHRDR
jgi:hypothetical protein